MIYLRLKPSNMKKIYLLSVLVFFVLVYSAYSQCVPDPSATQSGFYPNTQQGIASGAVGTAYSQNITLVIPKDTTFTYMGQMVTATINSFKITQIQNLPSPLTYTCNTANCQWPGNSKGCFNISGTPTAGFSDSIQVRGVVNVQMPPFPPIYPGGPMDMPETTYQTYKLNITGGTGLNDITNSIENLKNYPNPFSANTTLSFYSGHSGAADLKVFDILGKIVFQENISFKTGNNSVQFSRDNLDSGIYFYQIGKPDNASTGKMIIQD
jgi:hypothetical protein